MTNVHGTDDRVRSYELLAEAFRLGTRGGGVAGTTA